MKILFEFFFLSSRSNHELYRKSNLIKNASRSSEKTVVDSYRSQGGVPPNLRQEKVLTYKSGLIYESAHEAEKFNLGKLKSQKRPFVGTCNFAKN